MPKGVLTSPRVQTDNDGGGDFRAEVHFDAPDAPHTLQRIDVVRDEGCSWDTLLLNADENGVGVTFPCGVGPTTFTQADLNAKDLQVYEDITSIQFTRSA